ncbi:DUF3048 domain-containing protein [Candidatus Curtissbacteria bacterium]|nr:DUF3048 domain-containing protein [Candidatus Curtissbacteria bacterium]
MNKKKLLIVVLGAFILYAASAGVSYLVFSNFVKGPLNITTPFGSLTDVTSGAEEGVKDKPCPINGAMYTKNREDLWKKRRPLGVMIENHTDARPIIGLTRSDVTYEAVAEGGITRTLNIYYCQDVGDLAPIRSARTYFVDWVSEYSALYSHVGGANTAGPADALGQIRDYGILDMDQFGLGFPTYWRGTDKLAPHNVHSTTKKLWEAAAARGDGWGATDKNGKAWDATFVQWKFKDEAPVDQRGDQKPVVVPFWAQAPDYTVTWQYDKTANVYKRFIGTTEQIDPITKETMAPKNVVVQFETERQANDGYPDGHLLYGTIGTGQALFFIDGKAVKGTWNKASRTARTKYLDAQGKEVVFDRGQIWVQTIPVGNNVTY